MSSLITRTSDSATTSPTLVLGYETTRSGRNVVHDLINGDIAVTIVKPRPRSGTLELFYPDETEAWAAFALHSLADTYTLADTDRPGIGMLYVVQNASLALDDATRNRWVVSVEYQEIEP